MKKNNKIFGLIACSAVLAGAVTVGASNLNVAPAAADGDTAAVNFALAQSASVKYGDEGGIRFAATVYQNALSLADKVVLKSSIDKAGNTDEDEAITYEWDVTATYKTGYDTNTYYHAITFTDAELASYNLKEMAAVELTATMWLADDEGNVLAEAQTVTRSMRAVANAIYDGVNVDKQEELSDYFGTRYTAKAAYKEVVDDNAWVVDGGTVATAVYNGAAAVGADLTAGETATGSYALFDAEYNVYNVPEVTYVTKVIREASDLSALRIESYTKNTGEAATASVIDGYYVLGNNIDASSYTHEHGITATNVEISGAYGFIGVFDGCGYTIDGLNLDKFGFFGIVGTGAEIKNVAFTNVKFVNTASNGRNYVLASSIVGDSTDKVSISNVYIYLETLTTADTTWTSTTYAAVVALHCRNTTFDGVVIDYNENLSNKVSGATNCLYGSFIGANNLTGITATNTYVVSTTKLQNKQSDGSSGEDVLVKLGVVRYENAEAFNSAMEDTEKLNAFDNEYWDITGGIPVWKTFLVK